MNVSPGKESKLIHHTIKEMQTEMFCTHKQIASLMAGPCDYRKV